MTVAAVNEILLLFDLGVPLRETNLVYMTRPPEAIKIYDQITRPFPDSVWVVAVMTCMILSILMYFIHTVHMKDIIRDNNLVRKEELTLNFLLFPFTKITEPDALPWFEAWSSGKLAYFLWTVFSVFIIFFYTSNLRAHLIYIDYEKTPTGLKDIYDRGERVYIYDIAIRQR